MEEDNDEDSISDRYIIAIAINIANVGGTEAIEDENQVRDGVTLKFSPPQPNLLQQAQSPVVHLQNEFDDVNGYDRDEGPFYEAVNTEGPLIQDEEAFPMTQYHRKLSKLLPKYLSRRKKTGLF
jgi:hypothetical protein